MATRLSTHAKRLVGAACTGALLVGCVAGCGSANAAAGSDLITPAAAKAVVDAWLRLPDDAQIQQESGSLQRLDQAQQSFVTPGASPDPTKKHNDDTIWMAHQTQYPISFLVFDRPLTGMTETARGLLFRFSKDSPSAGWRVSHEVVLLANMAKPDLALDATGYAQKVASSDYDKLLASPANLAAEWSTFLQAQNTSDTREFAPGPLTTEDIDTNKKAAQSDAAKHYSHTFTYAPTDDPVDAYALSGGGALVLVAIQATDHVHANADPLKISDDGKGVSGPAPGSYRDVTTTYLVLAAFAVPPKGSRAKVTGVGSYDAPVTATGIKA